MKMSYFFISLLISFPSLATRIEVDVQGLSCGFCVESITRELKATGKIENISVTLEEKKARFSEIKDSKLTDAEIRLAIKKAGLEPIKIRRN